MLVFFVFSPPTAPMKAYLDGPMEYAQKTKLQFRVGDLDLPERRSKITAVGRRKKRIDGHAHAMTQRRVERT